MKLRKSSKPVDFTVFNLGWAVLLHSWPDCKFRCRRPKRDWQSKIVGKEQSRLDTDVVVVVAGVDSTLVIAGFVSWIRGNLDNGKAAKAE